MTRGELLNSLLEISRDVLDEEDLSFTEATPFEKIEEWDSLNHIHMVVRMEKVFGIRFDASELQSVVKVGDLLDIVARLKGI